MRTTSRAARRLTERQHVLGSPRTWIAALIALVLSGAVALATAPAQASSTVEVQLTLSGIASPDNPTGGSRVGVHPGDTVMLHSSAIPTAGAPGGLSGALSGLVAGVAGVQVKLLSGSLPGVHYPLLLGKVANCGGRAALPLRSLAKGSYSFHYVVEAVNLLTSPLGAVTGCSRSKVTLSQSELGTLTQNNVKVSDNAVYSGTIVVANNPPSGSIGVQLPSQSVSVKVGPVHTSVNLPGATVGVPNPVPGITSNLPSIPNLPGLPGGNANPGPKSGNGGGSVNYTPPGITVPEEVMPHAVNFGGAGGAHYVAPGAGNADTVGGHIVAAPAKVTATASPVADPSNVADAGMRKTVDLGAKDGLGGAQLPVLLAILAILALSVVTAGYARTVLLRRR